MLTPPRWGRLGDSPGPTESKACVATVTQSFCKSVARGTLTGHTATPPSFHGHPSTSKGPGVAQG